MKIKEVRYIVEAADANGKAVEVIVKLKPRIAFKQTKQDLEELVLDAAADLLEASQAKEDE